VIADLDEGRLVLPVQRTEENREGRRRSTRLLSASIASVGLAVLLTWPALPSALRWPLAGALALLYLRILILDRRLR
jgi:hypothetical protein